MDVQLELKHGNAVKLFNIERVSNSRITPASTSRICMYAKGSTLTVFSRASTIESSVLVRLRK